MSAAAGRFDSLPSVHGTVLYTLGPVDFDPDEPKSHEWAAFYAVQDHLDRVVGREADRDA